MDYLSPQQIATMLRVSIPSLRKLSISWDGQLEDDRMFNAISPSVSGVQKLELNGFIQTVSASDGLSRLLATCKNLETVTISSVMSEWNLNFAFCCIIMRTLSTCSKLRSIWLSHIDLDAVQIFRLRNTSIKVGRKVFFA